MRHNLFFICCCIFLFACQANNKADTKKTLEKAVQAFEQENYEQAILLADRILAENSYQPDALIVKIQCLIKEKQRAEGVKLLDYLILKNPKYHKAFAYRSLIHSEDKKYELALSDIKTALKFEHKNPDYQSEHGILKQQLGQHEEAIQIFSTIIEEHPDHESAYYFRAINKNKLKDKAGALADFDKAIQQNRNIPEMYSKRAFVQMDLNNYTAAIADFSRVIVLTPKEDQHDQVAIAFNNRGFARYKSQEFGLALDDINYSLQLFEDNAYAYKNRALTYFAQGKSREACHDLVLALQHKFTEQYGQEVVELRNKHCLKKSK